MQLIILFMLTTVSPYGIGVCFIKTSLTASRMLSRLRLRGFFELGTLL